jgi:hypothetical protein
MKIKNVLFLCILCLFIGSICTFLVRKEQKIDITSEVKATMYSQFNDNIQFTKLLYESVMNIDTSIYGKTYLERECNEMHHFLEIYETVRNNVSNNQKRNSDYDELLNLIESYVRINESDSFLLNISKVIENKYISIEDKSFSLDIVINHILHKYLSKIHVHAIPATFGKIINYAIRDTVKLGEIYQSKIFFNTFGYGHFMVMDSLKSNDTLNDCVFKERATKLGHNHRIGYYTCVTENASIIYKVDIDYYVK